MFDNGRILLCGHVHEKWKIKVSEKGTPMINCGVDVWDFKPVSIDQIMEIVKANNVT
jgi:calcineurin-like phosphoesterase family protein